MTPPKTLFFDIETCPCLMWGWRTGKQNVSSDQILEPSRIICISYLWEGETDPHVLKWDRANSDHTLLSKFAKVANKADILIGHNGDNFDVKIVNTRLAYHNMPPLTVALTDDTLKLARRKLRLESYKLDYLARYFKIGQKLETQGGIKLWLHTWLENNRDSLEQMAEYCKNDVIILAKVYNRLLPYLPVKANKALYLEGRACPKCGSSNVKKNGKRYISALRVQQQWICQDCGSVSYTGANEIIGASHKLRSR